MEPSRLKPPRPGISRGAEARPDPAGRSALGAALGASTRKSNHFVRVETWPDTHRARRHLRRPSGARAHDAVRQPGVDRVPFLADLPDDLEFVLALHEAPSWGWRPAGRSARRARARDPAHDRRARQRRRRARHRARQPRAARRPRRSAGSAPPRTRAVPVRQARGPRRRLPRLGRPACPPAGCPGRDRPRLPRGRDRPRAGPRHRADGRLGRGRRRGAASRLPQRSRRACARRRPAASWRSSPSCSPARARRRSSSAPGADDPARRGRRSSRSRKRLALPGLAGVVRRPRRVPPGSSALRGASARRPEPAAADARAARRRPRRRRAGVPPVSRTRRARSSRTGRGSRWSATIRPRRTAARPSSRCWPRPPVCAELARIVPPRTVRPRAVSPRPLRRPPPAAGEPLRAGHVFAALAERLPARCGRDRGVAVEPPRAARTPPRARAARLAEPGDGRPRLRAPGGDRAAHGAPDRPVVAIVGDGSSLYSIQALWSAAHYRVGALFVILSNGGYAVMDRLAEQEGGTAPWPRFPESTSPALRAPSAARPGRFASTTSSSTLLDEVFRTSPVVRSRSSSRSSSPRTRPSRRDPYAWIAGEATVAVPGPRFRPPRRDASEQIAFEIRRYLSTRGLRPDERLGTEQELAAEFGVSRPTLREGLRLLASSHLIRASQGPGGGIFVESTQNEGMGRNVSESIATMLETDSISLNELARSAHLPRSAARRPRGRRTRPSETAADLQAAIDAGRRATHPRPRTHSGSPTPASTA